MGNLETQRKISFADTMQKIGKKGVHNKQNIAETYNTFFLSVVDIINNKTLAYSKNGMNNNSSVYFLTQTAHMNIQV
jgi:hypothetical protein